MIPKRVEVLNETYHLLYLDNTHLINGHPHSWGFPMKSIDIYMRQPDGKFKHVHRTTTSATCKAAKQAFCDYYWQFRPEDRDESQVKCEFSK